MNLEKKKLQIYLDCFKNIGLTDTLLLHSLQDNIAKNNILSIKILFVGYR